MIESSMEDAEAVGVTGAPRMHLGAQMGALHFQESSIFEHIERVQRGDGSQVRLLETDAEKKYDRTVLGFGFVPCAPPKSLF